jgi:hypothetical protein
VSSAIDDLFVSFRGRRQTSIEHLFAFDR